MALRTERQKTSTDETTVLELALYKIFTWQDRKFEAGKPYRFRNEDAIVLMGERDHDRPIWKLYRPPVVRQSTQPVIVDATSIQPTPPMNEFGEPVTPKEQKRIEIGDDSEISDILEQAGSEGDVTV
jgi:hypothetical protein